MWFTFVKLFFIVVPDYNQVTLGPLVSQALTTCLSALPTWPGSWAGCPSRCQDCQLPEGEEAQWGDAGGISLYENTTCGYFPHIYYKGCTPVLQCRFSLWSHALVLGADRASLIIIIIVFIIRSTWVLTICMGSGCETQFNVLPLSRHCRAFQEGLFVLVLERTCRFNINPVLSGPFVLVFPGRCVRQELRFWVFAWGLDSGFG